MPKYRKKPVVIEAFQLGRDEIPEWFMQDARVTFLKGSAFIKTLEGIMTADTGDWIIKGVAGELYPCKPAIFNLTYEPVVGYDL